MKDILPIIFVIIPFGLVMLAVCIMIVKVIIYIIKDKI